MLDIISNMTLHHNVLNKRVPNTGAHPSRPWTRAGPGKGYSALRFVGDCSEMNPVCVFPSEIIEVLMG